MCIYAAAAMATFNMPYLGYPFVALSGLFLMATLIDFRRRYTDVSTIVFLGNVCAVLFWMPLLLILTLKGIDRHDYVFDTLQVVCMAGLIGAIACGGFIKFQS